MAEIHKDEDEGYLRDRLESGVMLGAFDGDILIGFIGVHGEGAMGLLQVHPDYRRRGVGKLLEAHQINHHLAWGVDPLWQCPHRQYVFSRPSTLSWYDRFRSYFPLVFQ